MCGVQKVVEAVCNVPLAVMVVGYGVQLAVMGDVYNVPLAVTEGVGHICP